MRSTANPNPVTASTKYSVILPDSTGRLFKITIEIDPEALKEFMLMYKMEGESTDLAEAVIRDDLSGYVLEYAGFDVEEYKSE